MTTLKSIFALAFLFSLSAHAASTEPAFCDIKNLKQVEYPLVPTPGMERIHAYKIGGLTLVGLGVGDSYAPSVQIFANYFSKFSPEEKSCTWYFNDGNDQAAVAFNHFYVPSPIFKGTSVATKYEDILSGVFSKNPVNMVNCAIQHGYIAMGCDGMRHRGPSVFAMLLTYAGCSAKSSTAIANKVWGTNWVPTKTREAIADKGRIIGERDPVARALFQRLTSGQ